MTISVESIFPSYTPKEMPVEELRFLLTTLAARLPIDLACIYESHEASRDLNLVVAQAFNAPSSEAQARICNLIRDEVAKRMPLEAQTVVPISAFDNLPQQTALLYPFTVTDSINGVL